MSMTVGASGGRELRGDLVCALCVRTVARVQGPRADRFLPRTIWLRSAQHADRVRRMRCPYCGGHLGLEDAHEVSADPVPVPMDDHESPRRRRLIS